LRACARKAREAIGDSGADEGMDAKTEPNRTPKPHRAPHDVAGNDDLLDRLHRVEHGQLRGDYVWKQATGACAQSFTRSPQEFASNTQREITNDEGRAAEQHREHVEIRVVGETARTEPARIRERLDKWISDRGGEHRRCYAEPKSNGTTLHCAIIPLDSENPHKPVPSGNPQAIGLVAPEVAREFKRKGRLEIEPALSI
jgi:hypothetical protein